MFYTVTGISCQKATFLKYTIPNDSEEEKFRCGLGIAKNANDQLLNFTPLLSDV